ncbi:MAG: hypothetical protein AB8I08_10485 [Sandaracinaceae bacterium]
MRYPAVSRALLMFIVAHGLGMLTMAVLLRGGMDAAFADGAARQAYVAGHPWAWRLGWVPWQLSALSNLAVNTTLLLWLRERRKPLALGWVALGLCVVAAIPEQWSELQLGTRFVALAQSEDTAAFVDAWRTHAWITGVWAAAAYTLMTGVWMRIVRQVAGRGAWGGWLETALLGAFVAGTAFTHVAVAYPTWEARAFLLGGALNGLAFPGLALWAVFAAARVGRAAAEEHPDPTDRAFRLRWPTGRALRFCRVLGSDGVRDLMRPLSRLMPYPTLRSDIIDVVYLTWLVPVGRVRPLLAEGTALDTYEVDGEPHTMLTVLTYRHGHFGPERLGPLRLALPSPAHSNWRLHSARDGGVRFLKNTIDSPLYTLGSRLLADGLPSHLPASMHHRREGSTLHTAIIPGDGSAPDLETQVIERDTGLPSVFEAVGPDHASVVRRIVHRGWVERPLARVGLENRSQIALTTDLDDVRPAELVRFASAWLAPYVEGCPPLAFVLPRVLFRSTGESWRRR